MTTKTRYFVNISLLVLTVFFHRHQAADLLPEIGPHDFVNVGEGH